MSPGLDPGLVGALVAGAAALIAAVVGVGRLFAKKDPAERVAGPPSTATRASLAQSFVRPTSRSTGGFLRPLARLAAARTAEEQGRVALTLTRGGFDGPRAVETFLAAKVGLAIVAPTVYLLAFVPSAEPTPYALAIGVWLCAGAFFAPTLWLRGRTGARMKAISRALPDAMDLLVTCVEAGLGLDSGLVRVAREMRLSAPELAAELHRMTLEVQAGMASVVAFRRMAERTGVVELRTLAAVLVQTETFGTSVGRALRIQSQAIRTRAMQRAEERAAMVAVKMTVPLILCILPTLLAVVMGPAVINITRGLLPVLGGGR